RLHAGRPERAGVAGGVAVPGWQGVRVAVFSGTLSFVRSSGRGACAPGAAVFGPALGGSGPAVGRTALAARLRGPGAQTPFARWRSLRSDRARPRMRLDARFARGPRALRGSALPKRAGPKAAAPGASYVACER